MCASEPFRCYLGTAPALGYISRVVGAKFAVTWLMSQIDYYSRTLKTADQLTEADTQHVAMAILANYPQLNLAEIMLFFSRLSGGIYGQVAYGQVRAENITAKIPDFLKHRAHELDLYEKEKQQLDREDARSVLSHTMSGRKSKTPRLHSAMETRRQRKNISKLNI